MSIDHQAVLRLAREAGAAIMAIYAQDFAVEHKQDLSPLTAADMAAHHLIVDGLAVLTPDVPVLSEESASIGWEVRRQWRRYWLVDPLDGTREFVKKNGEFTVNIALIEDGVSVFGVVYAPALDEMLYGLRGVGAFVRDGGSDVPVMARRPALAPLRVAASRSHMDARTAAAIERMGEVQTLGLGSSLKFCRLAEGRLDIYPRFGPTSEWDTAAGQAVLEAAGGVVLRLDGSVLSYNTKDSLLNPDFIALGDGDLPWSDWLTDQL
ncbi:MAG TPA: 3'(2'),5'-bisphosphate nucleotidase CysQ [Arenimonas sp.]|uniref:3'(2'),5'-bisphosphate nucleotidase CysQ n=1 Tax=Arenimonas sp. TaxID=1872635 RepID=UPI002D0F1813|nr:3'(2'),5'-bisphosphate nucleotidase CysQ [Arenimonas sp.]HMB57260.1 3'(2'),5'-bisphosphate nucleotidase CysQ [Arenimonas sp.]